METRQATTEINGSVMGMLTRVIGSAAGACVTIFTQGARVIDKVSNVIIHGVSSAEYISEAGEYRAKNYSQSIKMNGDLAIREQAILHKRRLNQVTIDEASLNMDATTDSASADEALTPEPATTATSQDEGDQPRASNGQFAAKPELRI